MKSKYSICWMSFVLMLALGLIGAGCGTPPPPPPVAWSLDVEKATPASVDVDIVGVQSSDEAQLMNMKPDDWWAGPPNNVMRRGYGDMMLTSNFQTGNSWVVAQNDPIWSKWLGHGVNEIMVISNLPRVQDNTPNDPRRKFLKLNKKAWKDVTNQTLEIRVQDDRVRVMTTPQAGM